VYVTDTNNFTVRKITPGGVVTTLAGLAGNTVLLMVTAVPLVSVTCMALLSDSVGNVYVADNLLYGSQNHACRGSDHAGWLRPGLSRSTDGTGSAARFNFPYGIAIDST
jgi:hypothetical protein